MIFAAGLGTRLGALTRSTPKALIPVGGIPMLERVALRLVDAGASRLIINVHHFADQIEEFVAFRDGFGVEVVFSHEREMPLETGGGLKRAAPLFRESAPFWVHNADVLTDLPLDQIRRTHGTSPRLATLAVMRRPTTRYLLFDDDGLLGRVDEGKRVRIEIREPSGVVQSLAFAGVHVLSPDIFELMDEREVFSILDTYLAAAERGLRILPFRVDGYRWVDIGKPAELEAAEGLFTA